MIYGAYGFYADSKTFIIELSNTPSKDDNLTVCNSIHHLHNAIKKHMKTDPAEVWQIVNRDPNNGYLKIVGNAFFQFMSGLGIENIKTVGC